MQIHWSLAAHSICRWMIHRDLIGSSVGMLRKNIFVKLTDDICTYRVDLGLYILSERSLSIISRLVARHGVMGHVCRTATGETTFMEVVVDEFVVLRRGD